MSTADMYYKKLRPSQPTIFVGRAPRGVPSGSADPLVGLLEAREKPDLGSGADEGVRPAW